MAKKKSRPLVNLLGSHMRNVIKSYIIDIPDLTPEQKKKVGALLEKAVDKALESAENTVAKSIAETMKNEMGNE